MVNGGKKIKIKSFSFHTKFSYHLFKMNYEFYGDEVNFDNEFFYECFTKDGTDETISNNYTENYYQQDDQKQKMDIIDNIFSINNASRNRNNLDGESKFENKNKEKKHSKNKTFQKRKLLLSPRAQAFKTDYYLIFTKKKKFPKAFLRQIHNMIQKPLNLDPITRDIIRFNDIYFERFEKDSFKIIQYIVVHKDEILSFIPELINF